MGTGESYREEDKQRTTQNLEATDFLPNTMMHKIPHSYVLPVLQNNQPTLPTASTETGQRDRFLIQVDQERLVNLEYLLIQLSKKSSFWGMPLL